MQRLCPSSDPTGKPLERQWAHMGQSLWVNVGKAVVLKLSSFCFPSTPGFMWLSSLHQQLADEARH